MNWNPLRKLTLQMARTDLDPSAQNANETLERLVAEFDSAENVTKSLYLAAKKLPDHILCMGKFETKLTDDLGAANAFAGDDFMKSALEEWSSFAFVSNTIGDEYVITLQKTVIEPLKQLKQAFTDLRRTIRLHDSHQFYMIKLQRKVASYSDKEKTGANLVKLEETKQTLANTQQEFARRTNVLVNELSKFLTASVEMLKPLLEGFIAAELAWVRATKRCLDGKDHITTTMEINTPSERLKNIEDSFKSMSALSICSESK